MSRPSCIGESGRVMGASVARAPHATEGNAVENGFHVERPLETAGNSISCQCLSEAVDDSKVQHKVLAAEVGMTRSQFSKSLSGQPGGDFNHVIDHIRPSIRLDYARRLADAELEGGLEELAAQRLAHAAIHYLSTRQLSTRKPMAKSGLK